MGLLSTKLILKRSYSMNGPKEALLKDYLAHFPNHLQGIGP